MKTKLITVISLFFLILIHTSTFASGIGNTADVSGITDKYLTKEIVGNALSSKLGTTYFSYADSLYPAERALDTHKASLVGKSPVFLFDASYSNYDKYNNIRHNFRVSRKNGVVWTAVKGNAIVRIENQTGNISNVTIMAIGEDTLIASLAASSGIIYKKKIPIRVTEIPVVPPPVLYNLSLRDQPTGSSSELKTEGRYVANDTVTIRATAKECYRFIEWRDTLGRRIDGNREAKIVMKSDTVLVAYFERDTFNLTISVSPISMMSSFTTTGAGRYVCGSKVEITATSTSCYKFSHWLDSVTNISVSTKSKDTILIDKDRKLVAVFVPDSFNVVLRVNPNDAGIVEDANKYPCGGTAEVSTQANPCYTFKNWTNSRGEEISKESSFTITPINKNDTLIAQYERVPAFEVKLSENPPEGGKTSGGGTFNCPFGPTTINATPNTGYRFRNWTHKSTGAEFSTQRSVTISPVDRNYELVANFDVAPLNKYTVTLISKPLGAGVLTGADSYYENDKASISAKPTDCYKFLYWKDENGNIISQNPDFTITVTRNITLEAYFEVLNHTITLSTNPADAAALATGAGTFPCGNSRTITARTSECYTFKEWTNDKGVWVSSSESLTFILKGDTALIAQYEKVPAFVVQLSANPPAGGTTNSSNGNTFNCPFGSTTITATPNTNYVFVNWTYKSTGVEFSNQSSVTISPVDRNYDLVANFELRKEGESVITLISEPLGAGDLEGGGTYKENEIVPISAKPITDCYKFLYWKDLNGNTISQEPNFNITVTQDITLVAHFEVLNYTVTLSSNPTNGGITTGAGTFPCGNSITVTAIANPNYTFKNWTDNKGSMISDMESFTFTVTSNVELTANFALESVNFTIKASKHILVDPNEINYKIPFYITSTENLTDLTIDKLVIEIDKNIFLPRKATNSINNSNIKATINRPEIVLENIKVPSLKANMETMLFTVEGDVLLGDKDSAMIFIQEIKFAGELNEKVEFINGYITLDICREGGDRLIRTFDYEPSIAVNGNPAIGTMHIECKAVEDGYYDIEMIDMLGCAVTIAKDFKIDTKLKSTYEFKIPIKIYGNGAYLLVMTSPTGFRYSTKFVILK